MADDEKEDPEEQPPADDDEALDEGDGEDEDEVSELKARVAELESLLAERAPAKTTSASWAGWVLGTLICATSLALIVVILGGGWPWPCECHEPASAPLAAEQQQQRQQAQLERLLREHSSDFQECFESWASSHAQELHPGWAVIVRLEIHADQGGRPQQVEASGENLPAPLGDCLEARVQLWAFPGPGPYTMELPFAIEGDPRQRPATDGGSPTEGGPRTEGGPAPTPEAGVATPEAGHP